MLNPICLSGARLGCYPSSSLKDFPREWVTIAFDRLGDEHRVRTEFRCGMEFLLQDIRQEQPVGPFDIVFCRHLVFTYFDESLQLDILSTILSRLGPNGVLVTGKQEPLRSKPLAWNRTLHTPVSIGGSNEKPCDASTP